MTVHCSVVGNALPGWKTVFDQTFVKSLVDSLVDSLRVRNAIPIGAGDIRFQRWGCDVE